MKTQTIRKGFTLVELLVVITIIGTIAALAIPAIGRVLRTVRITAMKTELTLIDQAVNDYRTKYGDFPPDFVDWRLAKRHYLKIFPDILDSELDLLFRLCDTIADDAAGQLTSSTTDVSLFNAARMNRAEALVWNLGGFSSDPQRPFTGPGGPLRLRDVPMQNPINPSHYQYNVTRNAPFIEFEPGRLSIYVPDSAELIAAQTAPTLLNRFRSTDELDTASGPLPAEDVDIFPVYQLREESSPAVYFDARTYAYNASPTGVNYNGFAINDDDSSSGFDAVRPVFADIPGFVPTGGANYGSVASAMTGWQFMNPQTFQVIAPGLDGRFSDFADADYGTNPADSLPAYFQITGNVIVPVTSATSPQGLLVSGIERFDATSVQPDSDNPFRDNMSNFIERTFEDLVQ